MMKRTGPILLLLLVFYTGTARSSSMDLDPKTFTHITFDDISPTKYVSDNGSLKMQVEKSSSFLVRPFVKPIRVKKVSFHWKSAGDLRITSKEHEASKSGDDSRLRVGLILSGEAPLIPFFAPTWVKAIRDAMKLPSDKLVYLVVGTKHKPGEVWKSPFSDSMELRAIGSTAQEDGWNLVNYAVDPSLEIVGLWIMADGDNTDSEFTTWLRDLQLL